MNKKKRTLVLIAMIFNFLSALLSIVALVITLVNFKHIYSIVSGELTDAEIAYYKIQVILGCAIEIGLNISAGICLLINLIKGQEKFELGRKLFLAGLVLNIISSLISVSTILLLIAYYSYIDIQVIKEKEEGNNEVIVEKPSDEDMAKKVEKLRKLKENGTISEEEFEKEILKLL